MLDRSFFSILIVSLGLLVFPSFVFSDSSFPANFLLSDLDGSNGYTLNGAGAKFSAGTSVANAGDVNGDGIDGDDQLDGLGGKDMMYGGAGSDTLHGSTGNDTMGGEAGNDFLHGGGGNDVLDGGGDTDDCNGAGGNGDIAVGCEVVSNIP